MPRCAPSAVAVRATATAGSPTATSDVSEVVASVIAVAGTDMRSLPLAFAVVVTLIVYWLAEEYAGLVEHASAGHLPTWAHVRAALRAKEKIAAPRNVKPRLIQYDARPCGSIPITTATVAPRAAI